MSILAGAISAGLGLIGGIAGGVQQRKAEERQYEREKEMMGLQYSYNNKMAEANQERAKQMWDYTNYEHQVQHMKNANLSVGLMYGQSGGGGATTSGGNGSGVSNSGTSSIQAGLQAKALGLQLASMASQVRLNESQAKKNEAEAEKTKGVDTEVQKANIESILAETSNKKEQKGLIIAQSKLTDAQEELARINANLTSAKIDEIDWNIKTMDKGLQILQEQLKGMQLDNDKKAAVLETEINTAKATYQLMIENILKTQKETQLTDAKIQEVYKNIWAKVQEVSMGWKGISQNWNAQRMEAAKIVQNIKVTNKQLDQKDTEILTHVVMGLMNLAGAAAMRRP